MLMDACSVEVPGAATSTRSSPRRLRFAAGIGIAVLAACGQKGPLVLPPSNAAPATPPPASAASAPRVP
ncbi:MAG TPA: lipoprotein [Caldimonas sp.]|nr:lipoprotein [Caldimonas sp.]